MQTKVQMWGNSLAVRIPKSLASISHLEANSVVEMAMENGKITLVPVLESKMTLAQLLDEVTSENCHGEVGSGGIVGQEAW